MGNPSDPPLFTQTPGPPQYPGFQQYAILTLTLDGGDKRARLTLTGPKAPSIGLTPTIGVGRDKQGNYHFLMGSGEDHVYKPQDVPAEILKLLGGAGGGSGGSGGGSSGPPTTQLWLPPREVLTRESDGAFRTFEQYEATRVGSHTAGRPALGTKVIVWPKLTPEIYYLLIDLYSGKGQRPLPGDYPLPSGDTRVG